jgi:hypothetical protein
MELAAAFTELAYAKDWSPSLCRSTPSQEVTPKLTQVKSTLGGAAYYRANQPADNARGRYDKRGYDS